MKRTLIALFFALCLTAGLTAAARAEEVTCAEALQTLGLFRGDGAGLAEERTLRRDEAAVMLVRLLGGEAEALAQPLESPFTDVDAWFAPYAGWLWQNGLTRGVSGDAFAPAMIADARQYLTFLLRALGYEDGVDFDYDTVEEFLTGSDQFPPMETRGTWWITGVDKFTRARCAEVTVAALGWPLRGEETLLGGALAARGVFSSDELAAALRPLVDSITLTGDGRLYHATNWDIPLPALGASADYYANHAWQVGADWVAMDGDGAAWIVDGAALERQCFLSASRVALVDSEPYVGAYYFYEYPGADSSTLNVLRWDGAEEVKTVYLGEGIFSYHRPYGAAYIILARSIGWRGYYDFIDLNTGLFSTPRYANGTMYLTTESRYLTDGTPDGAYAVVTFRRGTLSRSEVFLGDRLLAEFEEADTTGLLRAEDGPHILSLRGTMTSDGGFFVADGGLLLRFSADAAGETHTLIRVGNFAEPVLSAWVEEETVYVLTGGNRSSQGFYAVSDGEATRLLDERVLTALGITDFVPLDAEGHVALCRQQDIGMQHFDEYIYRYNAETRRVEVVGFRPGRWYGDMREEIAAYTAQMQALVDGLYGE